jgi:hypothetical protein
MSEILFEGGRVLEGYLKWQEKKMIDAINLLPPEQVRGADLESLVAHFTEQYRLVTPVLREDRKTVPFNVPVPGEQKVHIIVTVPYAGHSYFFRCWSRVPHPVDPGVHGLFCRDDALEFRLVLSTPDTAELTREFNRLLDQIKAGLAKIDSEARPFNEALPNIARDRLRARQEHLCKFDAFTGALPSLGFHLKHRGAEAEQVVIPVTQKPLPISNKTPSGQAPEPYLTLDNLDEVLGRVEAMIHVMERSPGAFAHMNEEHLRTMLLFGLNGLFEGAATGETFNGIGDTDILIRVLDRNVFLAECLIWHGPEHFLGKLDGQLFKYATWRDEQLVAIVFNRNKGFTEVVEKMRQVIREHDQCVRELEYLHESGIRCVFRRADDHERHFFLTALAYDVPRTDEE